jgi:hypothetical protein
MAISVLKNQQEKKDTPLIFRLLEALLKYKHIFQLVEPLWFSFLPLSFPSTKRSLKVLLKHRSCTNWSKKGQPIHFQTHRFKYKHIFQLVEPLRFFSLKILFKHKSCTSWRKIMLDRSKVPFFDHNVQLRND